MVEILEFWKGVLPVSVHGRVGNLTDKIIFVRIPWVNIKGPWGFTFTCV